MEINATGIGFTPASGYQAAMALQNTAAAVQQPAPAPASPAVIVSLSAAAAAEVKPEDIIDNSYAGRRDASDTIIRAVGMTNGARDIITDLIGDIAMYNGQKLQLADTASLEKLRQRYGDADADLLIGVIKRNIAKAQRRIEQIPERMAASGLQRFQISGPMVSRTEDGFYRPEKYTMTAKGAYGSYSVTVKSNLETKTMVGDEDITRRITDKGSRISSYAAASKVLQALEAETSSPPQGILSGGFGGKFYYRTKV